jgi:hypothetical protein
MSTTSPTIRRGSSQNWLKWLIPTLPLAVIAFVLSPNGPLGTFWRPTHDAVMPTGFVLLLFILLNVAEVLAFGTGISFLIFGYPLVKNVLPQSKGLAFAAYLSIGWLLINWWPHDSLHLHNGLDTHGLIGIEYGFHITLMIAGVILVLFFFALARQPMAKSQ